MIKNSQQGSLRFVLFATSVTAIGGFLFGYDTAVVNGALSYLRMHFNLNDAQEGLAGASAILGCIPGAMFAGFLSDKFGRKRMLFFCAILYAVSGVLSAIPVTFNQFLIARLVSGLGIGASSMICPVYIAEIAPEKWRGRLGTLFQFGIVAGIFLTLFINMVIQGMGDDIWNTATGWRWMLGMEAIPAIAFIVLLFTVPESPRWLALQGRENEARHILERVGGTEQAEIQMNAIREVLGKEEGGFMELFTPAFFRPLVIAVVLMAFSQFCGINAILYYSTKIFETAGASKTEAEIAKSAANDGSSEKTSEKSAENQLAQQNIKAGEKPALSKEDAERQAEVKKDAFMASVWIGLVNLIFTVLALMLVDKAGRKPLLIVGTAVQTVALVVVGWLFHVHTGNILLLLCVIATYTAAFAMSLGPIGWLFCSEVFPAKVRGRAMSIASMTVWISCYIVAQTFPMLKGSEVVGPAKTFWIYGVISLFACLFACFFIPETKGRTLEEIEKYWIRSGEASHPSGRSAP
jgi:MFS transporter, SP family, arabinose:H+ symporter